MIFEKSQNSAINHSAKRRNAEKHSTPGIGSLRLGLLMLTITGATLAQETTELRLNLQAQYTVSGLSSGGYMANQYHIAHSSQVTGAGILAAGPYYCSQGSLGTAMAQCLGDGSALKNKDLQQAISEAHQKGQVDSPKHLKDDKIWLLHGTLDKRVGRSVNDALYRQYQEFVPKTQIRYVNDQPFNHSFPTENFGIECSAHGAPFIAKCQFDAAKEMLTWLTSESHKAESKGGALYRLPQPQQIKNQATGLAEEAYVYIPTQCQQGESCQIHISFHGCSQNVQSIGLDYVKHTGINDWAEQHNTVVVYPQVASGNPVNPLACWDWWGYSSAAFHTKQAPQILAVQSMLEALNAPSPNLQVQAEMQETE